MDGNINTRRWLHIGGLLVVTAIIVVVCYWMVQPFLSSITTAVALAVLMIPLQRWLEQKSLNPSGAAAFTVFVSLFLIVAPIYLVGEMFVTEVIDAAAGFEDFLASGGWNDFMMSHPLTQRLLSYIERNADVPQLASTLSANMTSFLSDFVQASGAQIVATILSFYMLFFALRDRRMAVNFISHYMPLDRLEMTELYGRIASTIRATVFGTVLVSLVQGALGGLMFWWLGLPSPVIWGLVMGIAAIVPVLGTFIVWIPAAIFLAISGDTLSAIVLVLWGLIVVGGIDNLLYPLLVGAKLKAHTMTTFISIVGGIFVFGPAGLIIGPVVFTIARYLLDYWREHQPELEADLP